MIMKVVSPKEKYKDHNIYRDIVHYCTREDKCKSGYIVTENLDEDTIAGEMAELAERFGKSRGTRIRHTVFSFDESDNATAEDAFAIAQEACAYYAGDYQVFAAVHEDTDDLHFHMVMNTVNRNTGEKYKGRKKDYYAFQNHMRRIAHKNGMSFRTVK